MLEMILNPNILQLFFLVYLHRIFCEQTVLTVRPAESDNDCTEYQCPIKRTQGLYGMLKNQVKYIDN